MKSILLIIVFCQVFWQVTHANKIIACYWNHWSSKANFDKTKCTHVFYENYKPNSSGAILPAYPESLEEFLKLEPNSTLQKFASVGEFGKYYAEFMEIGSNSSLLSNFVNNCVSMTLQHGIDGIEFEWQSPDDTDVEIYKNILTALKEGLNANGKFLSTKVSGIPWNMVLYDIQSVCNNTDLINIMDFDYAFPENIKIPTIGYNTINDAASTWINEGCNSSKVIISLATYAFVKLSTEPGTQLLNYGEACLLLNSTGWTTKYYDFTPYSLKTNVSLGYENPYSLESKVNIVFTQDLAGVSFSSPDGDDSENTCGIQRFPLMAAVKKALKIIHT